MRRKAHVPLPRSASLYIPGAEKPGLTFTKGEANMADQDYFVAMTEFHFMNLQTMSEIG